MEVEVECGGQILCCECFVEIGDVFEEYMFVCQDCGESDCEWFIYVDDFFLYVVEYFVIDFCDLGCFYVVGYWFFFRLFGMWLRVLSMSLMLVCWIFWWCRVLCMLLLRIVLMWVCCFGLLRLRLWCVRCCCSMFWMCCIMRCLVILVWVLIVQVICEILELCEGWVGFVGGYVVFLLKKIWWLIMLIVSSMIIQVMMNGMGKLSQLSMKIMMMVMIVLFLSSSIWVVIVMLFGFCVGRLWWFVGFVCWCCVC